MNNPVEKISIRELDTEKGFADSGDVFCNFMKVLLLKIFLHFWTEWKENLKISE